VSLPKSISLEVPGALDLLNDLTQIQFPGPHGAAQSSQRVAQVKAPPRSSSE